MWLINTTTLRLKFFNDADDVEYVILSHTWGPEEVVFEDMRDLDAASSKAGWHKIQKTCEIASIHGYHFAWIDTCCIDKSSSAELSEAINAMSSWYRKSVLCCAYLSDLRIWPGAHTMEDSLKECRWFTRGWTLQELIASVNIRFYDASWNFVTSKHLAMGELSRITGIDVGVLEDVTTLSEIPIGRRMAWAAHRQTTRVEDMAYCLLGIFDISMPPLYGEGPKAFLRLQEEIARKSDDLTLFAWEQDDTQSFQYRAIFANSPAEFRNCSNLRALPPRFDAANEFSLTNRGLRITKNLTYWYPPHIDRRASKDEYLQLSLDCLECSERTENRPQWAAITLERFGSTYVRTSPESLAYCASRPSRIIPSPSSKEGQDQIVAYIARSLSLKDLKNLQSKAIVSITFKPAVEPDGKKYYKRGTRGGAEYTEIFQVLAPRNFLTYMAFPERFWQSTEIARPAIAFGFQGHSHELWAMPYREDDVCKRGASDSAITSPKKSHVENFLSVRDYVFEKFLDPSGMLARQKMPPFIEFPDQKIESWVHRFAVRCGSRAEVAASTHIVPSATSVGSFSIEFIHTIRDENMMEDVSVDF